MRSPPLGTGSASLPSSLLAVEHRHHGGWRCNDHRGVRFDSIERLEDLKVNLTASAAVRLGRSQRHGELHRLRVMFR